MLASHHLSNVYGLRALTRKTRVHLFAFLIEILHYKITNFNNFNTLAPKLSNQAIKSA